MKVKMLTSLSGPAILLNRGDVHDFPDAEAKRLIAASFAEELDAEPVETNADRMVRLTAELEALKAAEAEETNAAPDGSDAEKTVPLAEGADGEQTVPAPKAAAKPKSAAKG